MLTEEKVDSSLAEVRVKREYKLEHVVSGFARIRDSLTVEEAARVLKSNSIRPATTTGRDFNPEEIEVILNIKGNTTKAKIAKLILVRSTLSEASDLSDAEANKEQDADESILALNQQIKAIRDKQMALLGQGKPVKNKRKALLELGEEGRLKIKELEEQIKPLAKQRKAKLNAIWAKYDFIYNVGKLRARLSELKKTIQSQSREILALTERTRNAASIERLEKELAKQRHDLATFQARGGFNPDFVKWTNARYNRLKLQAASARRYREAEEARTGLKVELFAVEKKLIFAEEVARTISNALVGGAAIASGKVERAASGLDAAATMTGAIGAAGNMFLPGIGIATAFIGAGMKAAAAIKANKHAHNLNIAIPNLQGITDYGTALGMVCADAADTLEDLDNVSKFGGFAGRARTLLKSGTVPSATVLRARYYAGQALAATVTKKAKNNVGSRAALFVLEEAGAYEFMHKIETAEIAPAVEQGIMMQWLEAESVTRARATTAPAYPAAGGGGTGGGYIEERKDGSPLLAPAVARGVLAEQLALGGGAKEERKSSGASDASLTTAGSRSTGSSPESLRALSRQRKVSAGLRMANSLSTFIGGKRAKAKVKAK